MSGFGCTASAFEESDSGEKSFAPFGKAGSAYAAPDPVRMQALESGVRTFCGLVTAIVGGWGVLLVWQKLDHDPDRWRFGYALGAAFVLWFLAYGLWASLATRGLEKQHGRQS
jgi:hypothetical protein